MASYFDVLFAKLAVRNGVIDEARVRECFEIQQRANAVGYEESLPAILLKRGYLGGEQVRRLEAAQAIAQFIRAERTFARVVVARGYCPEAEVAAAFEASRRDGFKIPLSRQLVTAGKLTEAQSLECVGEQVRALSEEAESFVNPFAGGSLAVRGRSARDLPAVRPREAAAPPPTPPAPPPPAKKPLKIRIGDRDERRSEAPTLLGKPEGAGSFAHEWREQRRAEAPETPAPPRPAARKPVPVEIPAEVPVDESGAPLSVPHWSAAAADVELAPSGEVRLRVGERLVRERLITREQLDRCLQLQEELRARGIERRLGEILHERRHLDPEQLARIARALVTATTAADAAAEAETPAPPPAPPGPAVREVSSGSMRAVRRAERVVAIPGFDLVARLGQGALGVVYKARRHFDGQPLALKILPPSFSQSPDLVLRFQDAWERAKRLEHPSIVELDQLGHTGDYAWYTMEFVGGESLQERVQRAGPLSEADAAALAQQLAGALAHAEKAGITHRDLRPENVICAPDGRCRIGDVGLAEVLAGLSAPGVAMAGVDPGADRYASPEEMRGEPIDARSHVYSLGLVLFFAVTGQHPFAGVESARWRNGLAAGDGLDPRCAEGGPELTRGFAELLATATAADPARRYLDAQALLGDLGRLDHKTAPVGPPRPPGGDAASGGAATRDAIDEHRRARSQSSRRVDKPLTEVPAPEAANAEAKKLFDTAEAQLPAPPSVAEIEDALPTVPLLVRPRNEPKRPEPVGGRPLVGRVLTDRYRIVEKLRAGSFGPVYKADHLTMGGEVAVTVLSGSLLRAGRTLERFKRETHAASALRHPNLIGVIDAGQADTGELFVVSELVGGLDLERVIGVAKKVPPERALAITKQLLLALSLAHENGLVHGGLSPASIIMQTKGTAIDADKRGDEQVRIADFGLAAFLRAEPNVSDTRQDEVATAAMPPREDDMVALVKGVREPWRRAVSFKASWGDAIGVPAYLPPEQTAGGKLEPAADIYACGAILFEMLTGALIFEAKDSAGFIRKAINTPPRSFAEAAPAVQLDPILYGLCAEALAKERSKRFKTAQAMLAAVLDVERQLAAGEGARGARTRKPTAQAAEKKKRGATGEIAKPLELPKPRPARPTKPQPTTPRGLIVVLAVLLLVLLAGAVTLAIVVGPVILERLRG